MLQGGEPLSIKSSPLEAMASRKEKVAAVSLSGVLTVVLMGGLLFYIPQAPAPTPSVTPTSCPPGEAVVTLGLTSSCGYSGSTSYEGLVGYWPLNEGYGLTVNDLSGRGQTGALSSANGGRPIWESGLDCIFGSSCLTFNPSFPTLSTGVVDLGVGLQSYEAGNNPISFGIWYYLPSVQSGNANYPVIFSDSDASSRNGYDIFIATGTAHGSGPPGEVTFERYTTANQGGDFVRSLAALSVGWHNLVATYDGSIMRLYVDGSLVGSNSSTSALSPDESMYLGGVSGASAVSGYGTMSDFRVYSRALSASEVGSLYSQPNLQIGTYCSNNQLTCSETGTPDLSQGLTGWWPFAESSGSSAYDMTPNFNTASLVDSPPHLSGNSCIVGGCLNISSAYVEVPYSTSINTTYFSASTWIKVKSWLYAPTFITILGREDQNGIGWGLTVHSLTSTTGSIYAEFFTPSGGLSDTSQVDYSGSIGRWNLLSITYNGTVGCFYDNATQVGCVTTAVGLHGSIPFLIDGNRYNNIAAIIGNGVQGEVRLYNRALSPSEISELYVYANGVLPNPVYP
jgi:hypothetical protein